MKKNIKLIAVLLIISLFVAQLPVSIFAINETQIRTFSSYDEYMAAIGNMCSTNTDDLNGTYTIDLNEKTIMDEDNEIVTDYDDSLAIALMANDVNIANQLLKDTPYEAKKIENDKFTVNAVYQTRRLIVIVEDGKSLKDFCNAIDVVNYGNEYILQFATEKDTEKAIKKLSKTDYVENVVLDHIIEVDALSSTYEGEYLSYGISMMGLDKFQEALAASDEELPTIIVAVLDTGVLTSSKYFKGRLLEGINYIDSKDGTTNTEDFHGHGSHVAGTICDGTTNNVKILPVKVLDDNGKGTMLAGRAGIYWAVSQGADVLNMSWTIYYGAASGEDSEYFLTYYDAVLKDAKKDGCVSIAAAGNNSQDVTYAHPASSPYVITVGAIDENKVIASLSNYGEEIEFVAPGMRIVSVGKYGVAVKSGTSMAAPHIAAAAALMKTTDKALTQDEIVEIWKNSFVEDLGSTGKDDNYGYGLVNLANYLESPCTHDYITNITKEATCVENGLVTYTCSLCNNSYTEEIPAIGHTYECVTIEATCTENGSYIYTCTHCGDSYTEEIPAIGHTFVDVSAGCWYDEAVQYVYENGLMNGTSATTFSPNTAMDRGMIITVLYRMNGSPVVDCEIPFDDVLPNHYFYNAICWAYHNGIVKGVSETEFMPLRPITRAEMVTMFYRCFGNEYKSSDIELDDYIDADKLPDFAYDAFAWSIKNGTVKGTSTTTLSPFDTANRAQCAVITQRLNSELFMLAQTS